MRIRKILSSIKRRLYKNPRPSLNDLDRKLEKYLNFEKGFFIEAGANDGYSQSNTYFLERKRKWSGILVEGIPELFEKAKKQRVRSVVHNCALVSNEFSDSTVLMHYAHLMSVVQGSLKTEDEQNKHIKAGVDSQNLEKSYSVTVPARTLESVLDEFSNLPDIDFFSLDVEGYELDVLKGTNLAKYRPKYILVEILVKARFFEEVNSFLESHNYEMIEKLSHHDFIYRAI